MASIRDSRTLLPPRERCTPVIDFYQQDVCKVVNCRWLRGPATIERVDPKTPASPGGGLSGPQRLWPAQVPLCGRQIQDRRQIAKEFDGQAVRGALIRREHDPLDQRPQHRHGLKTNVRLVQGCLQVGDFGGVERGGVRVQTQRFEGARFEITVREVVTDDRGQFWLAHRSSDLYLTQKVRLPENLRRSWQHEKERYQIAAVVIGSFVPESD
jgi:hypothetical protein